MNHLNSEFEHHKQRLKGTVVPRGWEGTIRGCAAQQGIVFVSLTLEQGIQITVSVWNRGIFYVQFGFGNNTLEQMYICIASRSGTWYLF